jgi:hypothetical protein
MIAFIGLILNLLGTLIVSVAANTYMVCVHTALLAQELTTQSHLGSSRVVPVFTGLEKNREKELKKSSTWVRVGLFIIAVGFVLQAVQYWPEIKACFKK